MILAVRLSAYLLAAVKFHRFAAMHTWLNKLTGGAVFLLPYVLAVRPGVGFSWAICVLAFASSTEELLIHLFHRDYRSDRKSILSKG